MTNISKMTLYIGVTNDLCRRIFEHKNHLIKNSFTYMYNLEHCIYFEEFAYFELAIRREKELKKWSRPKKEDLINRKNPQWNVLVTEHGFVRNPPLTLVDIAENHEIPHFVTNDGFMPSSTHYAPSSSYSRHKVACHLERSEKTR
jgi:putative endonuclease